MHNKIWIPATISSQSICDVDQMSSYNPGYGTYLSLLLEIFTLPKASATDFKLISYIIDIQVQIVRLL